ncbi:cytochrome p450 protein, partial [Apiospora marii]
GNLLIAFTALFVPFVSSRFWRLFSIIFHQCYTTPDPRDTIHQQRQVVLRNATSPESGLATFARLLWAWRGAGQRRSLLRVLPTALFALLSIGAFTAAGGFSSKIASTGEVLLKGDNCTTAYQLLSKNTTETTVYGAYASTFSNNMASYAQQCYSPGSSGILECAKFVTRTIPTATREYNASCPFHGLCRRNSSNIRFDTGHLDSNHVFGLNSGKDSSLTFRYVLQCAPLATTGRTHNITVSDQDFTTYNYGPMLGTTYHKKQYDFTQAVPDIITQYTRQSLGSVNNINFLLNVKEFGTFNRSFVDNGGSSFIPDADLMRRDGQVSLSFLSGNGVYFVSPTDDDWYRANVADGYVMITSHSDNQTVYRPQEAAPPLGCIE